MVQYHFETETISAFHVFVVDLKALGKSHHFEARTEWFTIEMAPCPADKLTKGI